MIWWLLWFWKRAQHAQWNSFNITNPFPIPKKHTDAKTAENPFLLAPKRFLHWIGLSSGVFGLVFSVWAPRVLFFITQKWRKWPSIKWAIQYKPVQAMPIRAKRYFKISNTRENVELGRTTWKLYIHCFNNKIFLNVSPPNYHTNKPDTFDPWHCFWCMLSKCRVHSLISPKTWAFV